MHLDHINLCAFLVSEDGLYIVITQIDAPPDGRSSYPQQFHFGIMQKSPGAVHAKHTELSNAGLKPGEIHEEIEVRGAIWTAFYCPIGGGLDIEVNHRTTCGLC